MTIEQIGIGAAPGDNTGDGLRTAMGKVNNNFSNTSHAASKLTGTAPEDVPLNSNLGDSSTRNVGLNTGDVLSPEGAGLNNGETNWTSGNVNEFGGSVGIVGSGTASNTAVARIEIQTLSNAEPVSITLSGTFNLHDSSHDIVKTGATVVLSSSSTQKLLVLEVTGVTLTDGATYILYSTGAGSTITVNY